MRYPTDLELLLQTYANASSKEDIYIKKTLEDTVELLRLCDQREYYYAEMIARNLCHAINVMEKQRRKENDWPGRAGKQDGRFVQFRDNPDLLRTDRAMQFTCGQELVCAFYNHFKGQGKVDYEEITCALRDGRKDLVDPTLKDYVARIFTFSGPKYLGEMFEPQQLGGMDPVLFTYEHIELILAKFKTRNDDGEIVKQRVNIRSALRKLNEFKQCTEK